MTLTELGANRIMLAGFQVNLPGSVTGLIPVVDDEFVIDPEPHPMTGMDAERIGFRILWLNVPRPFDGQCIRSNETIWELILPVKIYRFIGTNEG